MKKSDLKTGMLIMRRDGSIELLINKTFILKYKGFNNLEDIEDNLTYSGCSKDNDIMKVSKKLKGHKLSLDNWTENFIDENLKWDREDIEIFACELDGIKYSKSTLRSLIKKATK